MNKIGICGHYGGNKICLDGQTIKTKIVTEELEKIYKIKKVDTFNGKKRIIKILFNLLLLLKNCENIIILPAHNSLKVFVPFLVFFNKIFNRKLHYIVIGGWLSEYISKRKYLEKSLKKFNYIYVETSMMKISLEKQGFKNIVIMPNCKKLKILHENELIYNISKPYKLCTFSRVIREKGIEDAIEAVKFINEKLKEEICILDIYGQIDDNYREDFEKIMKKFPEYIHYKGMISYDNSVDVLKNYLALLFPTRYYTEGIPGTIIDAYAAGIPVIFSFWENYKDIIIENETGLGYEFKNIDALKETLEKIIFQAEKLNLMKIKCLRKAKNYSPDKIIKILIKNL